MDATTTLKAEVKAWERDFRVQNGRNATVEDIKALPHIAEKYKLYKKLTKEASAKSAREQQQQDPPKTPPRSKPKLPNAAILPKSRPIASAQDVGTNNPFSPVKRRAANAAASSSNTYLGANPFLTPVKAKRVLPREASPPGPSQIAEPAPTVAISKARKRLRGEPVSPSPKPHEKRRRLDAPNLPEKDTIISPSRSPSSPSIEEGDSFLDDSPVKAPASGKEFRPLFEEANMRPMLPLSQPTRQNANTGTSTKVFARAKTVPGGLFGGSKKEDKETRALLGAEAFADDIPDSDGTLANGRRKGKDKEQPFDGAQKSKKKRILPGPRGLIPGKDDLFEQIPSETRPDPPRKTKNSRKRSLSEATKDEQDLRAATNVWNLLPPSPPPPDENSWQKGKGKGKMKAKDTGKGKSKKAKIYPAASDEDMEDGISSESAEIKIVTWGGRSQSPRVTDADDTALDLDPELQFHLRGRQAGGHSPLKLEDFEVDLPEEMWRVLALSPGDQAREREEEDLVKDLMQGQRKGRGEVWGPGEIGGEGNESDEGMIEEDWEGEGIPWEVAEL